MFFVEHRAHNRQYQVNPKSDGEMGVQENVRKDAVIHEIKDRPSSDGDIQQQADDQARVVAFASFYSQNNMGKACEKGKVGNLETVLII